MKVNIELSSGKAVYSNDLLSGADPPIARQREGNTDSPELTLALACIGSRKFFENRCCEVRDLAV